MACRRLRCGHPTGKRPLSPSLLTGDANNDNSVDSTDFGLVLGAFGGNASNPASGYDPACDLDCDGLVNSTDFALLIGDYGSGGDELPAGTALPLSLATVSVPVACLQYADVATDVYGELTGVAAFGYVSNQPETVRFEDDFTPNAMQTHLILATRNYAHVCIYEAPAIVAPARVLTAPGTVMYDADITAAPSGQSIATYVGVYNCLHTLDITLTAGTAYHIAIDYDNTANFENAPAYATSYGFPSIGAGGFNGVTLFPVCNIPASVCFWSPVPEIQTAGIASVSSGAQVWTGGGQVPLYPIINVKSNALVTFVAAPASDFDTMTTIDLVAKTTTTSVEADTVSYLWQANGGAPFGSGQTFNWNAPIAAGTYTVSLTVNDGAPDPAPCKGDRDDAPKVFTFTVIVCDDAHPSNFRLQPGRTAQEITAKPFELDFNYVWDSSDGNPNDIGGCTIRENVTYDGNTTGTYGSDTFTHMPIYAPQSPPFAPEAYENPTISSEDINGNAGIVGDMNFSGTPVKPYSAASFTATQYWEFHCNGCMQMGEWQRFAGPFTITRSIYQNPAGSGNWFATITKNGYSSTMPLGRN